MLVLSRKPAEAIRIGDDIIVKVIAIRGGQVKLGIEAPQGVRVIRTEPYHGERQSGQTATSTETAADLTTDTEKTDTSTTSG